MTKKKSGVFSTPELEKANRELRKIPHPSQQVGAAKTTLEEVDRVAYRTSFEV